MTVTASDFNVPIEALFNRTAYLRALHARSVSVLNYGADPLGATDSLAAFNAACTAVLALGGGTVLVPNGAYRINGSVIVPRGVSIVGDGAILYQEDNSDYTLQLDTTGPHNGPETLIDGIAFEGLSAGKAGDSIFLPDYANPRAVRVRNCTHNEASQNLAGPFVSVRGALSRVAIENCRARARSSGETLIYTDGDAGAGTHLEVVGGLYRGAATYDRGLLNVHSSTLLNVERATFDFNGHTTGTAYCIDLSGVAVSRTVRGCTFVGAGDSYALRVASGTRVVESDSVFSGITAYSIAAALTSGSSLGLRPAVTSSPGTAGPFNIADLGVYRNYSYRCDHDYADVSGPDFVAPTALFAGQRLTLTAMNNAAGDWAGAQISGASGSAISGPIASGYGLLWELVALDGDSDGDLAWNVVSTFGPFVVG